MTEESQTSPLGVPTGTAVDVLVIGAGINGIYQLYQAREAGFTALLIDQAEGVGGTWFWNRYPGARFDSESYTYGYLFDDELYNDWKWSEHFAGQPEIEEYLNFVVDRFELRNQIELGRKVESVTWNEDSDTWIVLTSDGVATEARFVVAATGRLSVPIYPQVPGREDFRGESYHTGLWPQTPVDFTGKRVAVIGTGSSGVQIIPAILDEVARVTAYQRTANWCTPLNNAPITDEEQRSLRENFHAMREKLNSDNGGFLHTPSGKFTFDDSPEERQAFYEQMWNSPGFAKLTGNYSDLTFNPEANEEWCEFLRNKIRTIVKDPVTADRLIPKNHGFAHKRPPYVTNYFESFNDPKASIVDMLETPIVRVTETGIETTTGHEEYDIIVWATGFDFGTGALNRLGIVGRDGKSFKDHWSDGPTTFLGLQSVGFPNLFYPGGPHGSSGNAPRSAGDMIDFVTSTLVYMREKGYTVIETTPEAEDGWTDMINDAAASAPFTEVSYFFGTNVPGKPRRYLLNPKPRAHYKETLKNVVKADYKGAFILTGPGQTDASGDEAIEQEIIAWNRESLV